LEKNTHGTHKEEGYCVYRQPILDALVGVFFCMKQYKSNDKDINNEIRLKITAYKRQFVSKLQCTIDPRRRIEFLEKEVGNRQQGENKR
jgi:hypothetical protein